MTMDHSRCQIGNGEWARGNVPTMADAVPLMNVFAGQPLIPFMTNQNLRILQALYALTIDDHCRMSAVVYAHFR
uniref:Uncharacterized protein n=1 Tax=Vespula pensylvanica TaxID=30213 RepID=A0A834KJ27_VESPE|nr:hypothetical protein H0235_014498 [Vespula pensylvanica]